MRKVYKYREDSKEMIEIGVVDDSNKVILNEFKSLSIKDNYISLYDTEFYIKKAEDIPTYQYIFFSNKEEIREVFTKVESRVYAIGYLRNSEMIFYDSHNEFLQ